LTWHRGIRRAVGKTSAIYIHLKFARHEIICANGVWTESLHIGAMAQRTRGLAIQSQQPTSLARPDVRRAEDVAALFACPPVLTQRAS